jgi:glycosyltransferase involved in cell wall biosynthesis
LRVLFTAPSYWPSTAFGGPVRQMYELAAGLVARGHAVEVVTTSLVNLDERPNRAARTELVAGSTVHYLGTPLRYRWIGITPSLGRRLGELPRPDVAHVFGFRDYVGTRSARWARREDVPYVFEGLGMLRPKLHKVKLKSMLDGTVYRGVVEGARLLVASSGREHGEYLDAGVDPSRIVVRPIGFPSPRETIERPGALRRQLGLEADVPLLLSVGRVAPGKGIDWLIRVLSELDGVHLVVVGPDDRGTTAELVTLARTLRLLERVHLLGPRPPSDVLELYGDADVFVLASASESFGMAAAEAAAAGTVPVVTDRCGIADLLGDGAGLVIPYDPVALGSAIAELLADPGLRLRLGEGARAVAAEWSWPRVVELQETIYRQALEHA